MVVGQGGGAFRESRDHPAIAYSSGPVHNPIAELNGQLRDGEVHLEFEDQSGYLRSVLRALEIPIESQVAVFSQTSFQAPMITSANPRAIYFSDSTAAAWVRGAEVIEVATHDRQQGAVFYVLQQEPTEVPQFRRNDGCLSCHLSWETLGVPGFQVLSTAPLSPDPNAYATGFVTDHRSPLGERWGGWYVTGTVGPVFHMGNVEVTDVEEPSPPGTLPPAHSSLEEVTDIEGYLSPHSDVVALMVLNHQVHMANLISRIGWEARTVLFRPAADDTAFDELILESAAEVVDYMLFVDEAKLAFPVSGSSGFAERFVSMGPQDPQGRSLRELDLGERLFRHPCSYMIYSEAFDALPDLAKDAVYQRMWEVLSGEETGEPYTRLSLVDRQAIVEILRATKADLPAYFRSVTQ
jgi:hypothetical protein